MSERPNTNVFGFKIIGAFKLLSAVLLVATGVGIFKLVDRDLGEVLTNFLAKARLDPGNHVIHMVISKVSGIDRHQLRLLGVGTFFYAILHTIEGVGLLLEKRWAGYVTILLTGSLLPVEGYEVFKKLSAVRISVLIVNAAIVVYLIVKLRQERQRNDAPATEVAASPPG